MKRDRQLYTKAELDAIAEANKPAPIYQPELPPHPSLGYEKIRHLDHPPVDRPN